MITREKALQTIRDCRITPLGELAHRYTVYQATANILINQLFDQFESQLSSNPLQLTCEGCKYFIEKYDDEMDIEICDCIVNKECIRNYIPYYYSDLYESKE